MSDSGEMVRDPNCLFCKIIDGQIPSKVVNENEYSFAIRDVNPQAPTHILVLPKNHIANIGQVSDSLLLGRLFQTATELARTEKLDKGYRIVVNTGDDGGQTVHHLHIHLVGGRALGWPPG